MAGTQPIRPQQFAVSTMEQLWQHRACYAATTAGPSMAAQGTRAARVERTLAARQSQANGAVDPLRNRAAAITLAPRWRPILDLLPANEEGLMANFGLQRDWKQLLTYETFERIASRIVMFFIAIIIVYTLILMAMTLFDQIKFSPAYIDTESLRDVFGSILSILILIEFNHSIALAISKRSGVLQARPIVLITILVIARKVILLDFATTTFEQLVGIGALALAFGLLFWLINARSTDLPESQSHD
jgi:uncharacterized membrane protein (DUF373 family)